MNISRIPFDRIPQLSRADVAYATGNEALRPFYEYPPELAQFAQAMARRRQFPFYRSELVDALRTQYRDLPPMPAVQHQVELLGLPNTFTVATAHQPCLLTGPLYVVYKIINVIRLATQLAQAYPDYHFVPVFVSGSEDHDFEEINRVRLFGKTLEWHSGRRGAVGAMPAYTLQPLLTELQQLLGEAGAEAFEQIRLAYSAHDTYGKAALDLLHRFFGAYGLVVLDASVPALKRLFVPAMERELLQRPSQKLVGETQQGLEAIGFSPQAHARHINLFYLQEGLRERIVKEDNHFKVLNTDLHFSEAEILAELHAHPERFSPNVVMRPLYQETILPNLAYTGGGGEIAYWLERKSQFAYFGVHYPMLVRRSSVWWLDEAGRKRMAKLGIPPAQWFEDVETLVKQYVAAHAAHEIDLAAERAQIASVFGQVLNKAVAVDPTLEKAVLAEQARQLNALESLEAKILRAEKQKQDTALQQLRNIKEKYFPGNGLQERHDNFLPLYLRHGRAWFDTLLEHLDPLTPGFIIMEE